MIRVLAFDVSETLQTGAEHDDGGLGQPMMMGDDIIPNAYSVLIGGTQTAALLKQAQANGISIVLVTNNGNDLDKGVISRTLEFLQTYGITITPENYMGPPKGQNGNKVPRLEDILKRFNIGKDELLFFDDSSNNIKEALSAGFQAIRVQTATDLQDGIREVINQQTVAPQLSSKVVAHTSPSFSSPTTEQVPLSTHLQIQSNYAYGEHSTRFFQAMRATCPKTSLSVSYQSKSGVTCDVGIFIADGSKPSGDKLKRQILKVVENKINEILLSNDESSDKLHDLNAFQTAFKRSNAYGILAKSQGITTAILSCFGKKTDSVKALNTMFDEACDSLEHVELTL